MATSWFPTSRRLLSLLILCLASQHALAGSQTYSQKVTISPDAKPSLQLTNDSDLPITAFIMVEFPSLGMEGRTYFDTYTSRAQPIPPGTSITRNLSSFAGSDVNKVRAEVRAVIFKDGSSAGDTVWVNAILARRLRLYDRILSIHDLLSPLVGTGISREAILDTLRVAQEDADQQLPEDDLRIMDDLALYGAISTFDTNRKTPAAVVIKAYLKYLEKRALQLEYSRPDPDTIRTLPVSTPEPLSEADLPADFRAAAAALSSKAANSPTGLSYCSVSGLNFIYPAIPQDECVDSEGNGNLGFKNSQYTSFSNPDFFYHDGSTNKDTTKPWSWSPSSKDLSMAWGRCDGFWDCDGNWDVFYTGRAQAFGQGAAFEATLNTIVTQGQNSKSFYFAFDDYQPPTFVACDPCHLYPDNQYDPVSINKPQSGVTFYFNCYCTVTPQ